jgi:hypothetical protein
MYFVTIKHPEYVLFATTPSERAAIGLTEKQIVRLLIRRSDGSWDVRREWDAARFSHTAFMSFFHHHEEPDDPERLLEALPLELR